MAQLIVKKTNGALSAHSILKRIVTVGFGGQHDIDMGTGEKNDLVFTLVGDGNQIELIPSSSSPRLYVNAERITGRRRLAELDRIEHRGVVLTYASVNASLPDANAHQRAWSILERLSLRLQEDRAVDAALDELLQELLELSGAQYGVLMTADTESSAWSPVATSLPVLIDSRSAFRQFISHTILKRALETRAPVFIENIIGHPDAGSASIQAMQAFSIACLPLTLGDRVLGAAFLFNRVGSGSLRAEGLFEVRHLVTQACLLVSARQRATESQAKPNSVEREVIPSQAQGMIDLLHRCDRIAASDLNVVIVGESGTGKELIARRIHARSPRASQAFVSLNCAAIPETLLESMLFGHEKGAYTGASQRQDGKFHLAHGGTLFLDEIGDLPLAMQAKILRAIQEHEVERIGSPAPEKVDVRVIAATHRDLPVLAASGRFRPDLLYRLDGVTLKIPALRERRADIAALASHFLATHSATIQIEPAAMRALEAYDWPGNVRQLEQLIKRAAVLSDGVVIRAIDLAADLNSSPSRNDPSLKEAQKRFTRDFVDRVLDRSEGNRAEAADRLGISERSLYRILSDESVGLEL